ncbi:MAG: tRNA (adenosine(37)-N6)-dimethylallyltransferase MiaA [Ruminobacter sp.]|nr:tRNA (adenosine(37)-N6)-dimethylallyltransferase MiaA [Ruminobacter sp.]
MGPTASGKTALGVELAKEINGEIISVDSALIYKGMDIGTAKPTVEEMQGIPHHLISIIDPSESYSVASFRKDSLQLISEITVRGKVPILVGGTMLYYKSLIDGLSPLPDSTEEVRNIVNQILEKDGVAGLREKVKEVDLENYERLSANDKQRLGRAYEVFLLTGKSMTEIIRDSKKNETELDLMQFALLPERDRSELKLRIVERFDKMLASGFKQEVEVLYERGDLNLQMPSIRSVGYKQMWMHLNGEISFDEMRELGIIATCQLAKRQMTWLRGWKSDVNYLVPGDKANLSIAIEKLSSRN